MESLPPYPIAPGQRLLAAIVFTDVVGFSGRIQLDEVATLGLLDRDVATMREFSEKYSGSVLKTTGDGLLLYFTSAVHAVAWSLKTQRHFAELRKSQPASQVLLHRVGVHLGDIFVSVDDVMGDGVNIAARVQGEAPPGGICISQTVYDVVKRKLDLHVRKLEPRRLKNLHDLVPMYHVLLEAPPAPVSDGPALPPPAVPEGGPSPRRGSHRAVLTLAILFAMALVAALVIRVHLEHQDELDRSHAAQVSLEELLAREPSPQPNPVPARSDPGDPADPGTGYLDLIAGGDPADPARAEAVRIRAQEDSALLPRWVSAALERRTRDNPLLVRDPAGLPNQDLRVFSDGGRLSFAQGGAIRARDWNELKPGLQGAIVAALLQVSAAAPDASILRAAAAFAYLNNLEDLAAQLRAIGNPANRG